MIKLLQRSRELLLGAVARIRPAFSRHVGSNQASQADSWRNNENIHEMFCWFLPYTNEKQFNGKIDFGCKRERNSEIVTGLNPPKACGSFAAISRNKFSSRFHGDWIGSEESWCRSGTGQEFLDCKLCCSVSS